MKCPYCSFLQSKVVDSRPTEDGNSIRRRRECEKCKKRFTTYERLEALTLMVIKKDGTREVFDRDKILKGLIKSCEKRPVSIEKIETIVSEMENHILRSADKEIPSKILGEMVMKKLKELDEVAYVRFASVYKQFKDIDTFMKEIQKIREDKG